MIVRVIEAQDMAEFMYCDPVEINCAKAPWTRIGAPVLVAIKMHITIDDFTRRIVEPQVRNGQCVLAKGHAALRVRPDDGVDAIHIAAGT